MTPPPEDGLTIAEAAARLGVSERALRRLITRAEFAASVRQVSRQTRRGVRLTAVIPPSILSGLKDALTGEPRVKDEPPAGEEVSGFTGGGFAAIDGTYAAIDGTLPARVYQERVAGLEAVNAEQAQRVADLQGRVEALEADKKELYAVLQREQTLRSLPAPAGDDGQGLWARLRRLFGA